MVFLNPFLVFTGFVGGFWGGFLTYNPWFPLGVSYIVMALLWASEYASQGGIGFDVVQFFLPISGVLPGAIVGICTAKACGITFSLLTTKLISSSSNSCKFGSWNLIGVASHLIAGGGLGIFAGILSVLHRFTTNGADPIGPGWMSTGNETTLGWILIVAGGLMFVGGLIMVFVKSVDMETIEIAWLFSTAVWLAVCVAYHQTLTLSTIYRVFINAGIILVAGLFVAIAVVVVGCSKSARELVEPRFMFTGLIANAAVIVPFIVTLILNNVGLTVREQLLGLSITFWGMIILMLLILLFIDRRRARKGVYVSLDPCESNVNASRIFDVQGLSSTKLQTLNPSVNVSQKIPIKRN